MTAVRSLLILMLMFLTFNAYTQDDHEAYQYKIKEASKLYKAKKYKESAEIYAAGFAKIGRKAYPTDRYNAACSYALAEEKDSAFFHLTSLAKGKAKYRKLSHITTDSDLNTLHSDKRWDELIELVKFNKEEHEKYLEEPLIEMLDSVYRLDQEVLKEQSAVAKKYGWKSEEVKALDGRIAYNQSITEPLVTKLLDERGWLGAEVVGNRGNSALFLVIQHSDLQTQQKYLPMMRQAVKDGKARGSSFALLEDRVNLKTGKKQIYGSQIGRMEDQSNYVRALEDPMNVDKRRAEVGLEPLSDYTQNWNFSFDAEEYLKKLPEYEKILKEEYELSLKVKTDQ